MDARRSAPHLWMPGSQSSHRLIESQASLQGHSLILGPCKQGPGTTIVAPHSRMTVLILSLGHPPIRYSSLPASTPCGLFVGTTIVAPVPPTQRAGSRVSNPDQPAGDLHRCADKDATRREQVHYRSRHAASLSTSFLPTRMNCHYRITPLY